MDVLPDERLAASDAEFRHAQINEQAREAGDLLVGEDGLARQEVVALAVDFGGHAVPAAEVAAVGHRDSQVADRPAERVGDFRGLRRLRLRRHRAACAGSPARSKGRIRRAACPRWLTASFSSGSSSAIVLPNSGRWKTGS